MKTKLWANIFTQRIAASVKNDMAFWIDHLEEYNTMKAAAGAVELHFMKALNGLGHIDQRLYDLLLLALKQVNWVALAQYIFRHDKDKVVDVKNDYQTADVEIGYVDMLIALLQHIEGRHRALLKLLGVQDDADAVAEIEHLRAGCGLSAGASADPA